MFDSLLKSEIDQIVWLQNVGQPMEGLLEVFSTLTKSSAVNLYLLPICCAFDVQLYTVLMFVSCFTGYATHILKWLLADSRPYWWVQLTDAYGLGLMRPTLRQTEITCETSAGNPSGHVMLNAACWFVLVHHALKSTDAQRLADGGHRWGPWLRPLCWGLYTAGVCMVAVSRMYYACHYLHQCVLGAALGYGLCRWMVQTDDGSVMRKLLDGHRLWLALLGVVMAAVAVVVYFGQIVLQVDPLWSIRTAFNWCENPLNVRPETTTVYCIVRDLGLFFGLVLAAPLSPKFGGRLDVRYSVPVVSVIVVAYSMLSDYVPRQDGVLLFYASTFVLNVSLVYGMIEAVTRLCILRQT